MGQVEDIVRALELTAERVVAQIALDCRANLVAAPQEGGTPIDTGWASASWVASVGSPSTFGGPRGDVGQARAEGARGVAELLGYKLGKGTVFISNNAPYIGRLNDGWSKQAEAGFVERAVAKALNVDIRGLSGQVVTV